jgi:hypothetical protein
MAVFSQLIRDNNCNYEFLELRFVASRQYSNFYAGNTAVNVNCLRFITVNKIKYNYYVLVTFNFLIFLFTLHKVLTSRMNRKKF